MYRTVRILTQSPSECLFKPGRIVKIYYNYFTKEYCGIKYNSCGCEVYSPVTPDFDFEILD